ncbi:hypothetical protein C8R47DRAFT_612598 [Mycena vitilis]|nr:hypothetical protein C8R47DRAFT_612598 [Mycena vitilis]
MLIRLWAALNAIESRILVPMSLLYDDGDRPYAKAMARHWELHGKLLLNPASSDVHGTPARIGDVGYFKHGQFILLFHTVDDPRNPILESDRGRLYPNDFVPFQYMGGIRTMPLPQKSCLRSDQRGATSFGGALNAVVADLTLDVRYHNNTAAFVFTRHRQYIDNASTLEAFLEYAKVWGQSWYEWARAIDRTANPVIITGLNRSRDFITSATVKNSTAVVYQWPWATATRDACGRVWL